VKADVTFGLLVAMSALLPLISKIKFQEVGNGCIAACYLALVDL